MKHNKKNKLKKLSPPQPIRRPEHSHLGSRALPVDLNSEGVLGNLDLVQPAVLIGVRSGRNRQLYRNLKTFCGWVPDLDMGVDVTRLCQAGKQDGRIEFKEKHSHRERSSTTTGTKRQENTYLKLQHVTFVVNDLNAQIVDVW